MTAAGSAVPQPRRVRAGLYARVSTTEQTPEPQLLALRAFATARGWTATEYVDVGISGTRASRLALDALMTAAQRRHVDAVVTTKLDQRLMNASLSAPTETAGG